jgi:phosphatidylglycerophosphate synthase
MPPWVTPDRLTGFAFLGALMVFGGYSLYPIAPSALWIVNLGFVAHWFGDSLDGSLARYRKIERPRYGFYLDNGLDIVSQFALAIGLAFSGLLRAELAFIALSAFYMVSQISLMRAHVIRVFPLTYGRVGTTELRVIFIILNISILAIPPSPFNIFGITLSYPDILTMIWIAALYWTFWVTMTRDLRSLAAKEPPIPH